MAPRKRGADREGWPENLYPNGKYYRYVHPITKDVTSLNCSFGEACQAAGIVNAHVESERDRSPLSDLVGKIVHRESGQRIPFSRVLEKHREERFEQRPNPRTKKTLKAIFKQIENAPFMDRPIREIQVLELDLWMQGLASSFYPRVRRELIGIWKLAIRRGWQRHQDGNPAEHTENKPPKKRERQRLTFEAYTAIYNEASNHLKLAMYIMLHTTLRPCDVVWLKKSDVNGNLLRTKIRKSEKDLDESTAKYLEIEFSNEETADIKSMWQTGIASPFIVHKATRPRFKISSEAEHWSQCTVDLISDEFRTIRDVKLKLFKDVENSRHRPSLYECRSLARHLYKLSGRDDEDTQALMAHTDRKMTDIYNEGHKPEYTRVRAGLDLSAIPAN